MLILHCSQLNYYQKGFPIDESEDSDEFLLALSHAKAFNANKNLKVNCTYSESQKKIVKRQSPSSSSDALDNNPKRATRRRNKQKIGDNPEDAEIVLMYPMEVLFKKIVRHSFHIN